MLRMYCRCIVLVGCALLIGACAADPIVDPPAGIVDCANGEAKGNGAAINQPINAIMGASI